MSTISSSWILLLVTLLVSSLLLMATASSGEIYENRGIKSGNGGEENSSEKGIRISDNIRPQLVIQLISRRLRKWLLVNLWYSPFVSDKRPFFVGSRYGRSQSDLTNMDGNGKSTNMARVVPRNDRFFFGSRYGKRSSPYNAIDANENQLLTCFYSGITNLFRCVE